MRRSTSLLLILMLAASGVRAQQKMPPSGMKPMHGMATSSGQAAFATIAEVVRILEADSTTDWSRVNLEALRQHLIDMDNVTMRSRVRQAPIAGGQVMTITGAPPVAAAIQRMVGMHAMMLGQRKDLAAEAIRIPGGMRLSVTARDTADARLVARIRGLGFIGLMTEGEHHAMHHLMLARGGTMMTGQ